MKLYGIHKYGCTFKIMNNVMIWINYLVTKRVIYIYIAGNKITNIRVTTIVRFLIKLQKIA